MTGSGMVPGRWFRLVSLVGLAAMLVVPSATLAGERDGAGRASRGRQVKILVINMFEPEARPFVWGEKLAQEIPVPGLSPDGPAVRCNRDDVCQVTVGMGSSNSATSMAALVFGSAFDLRRTYFLIAGVAGIDPAQGTLGTTAWARFVVDFTLQHEIDAREMPAGWPAGYLGIFTAGPEQKPRLYYHNEVFQLDETLLQRALALTRGVALDDDPDAREYRSHYPTAPANAPPRVTTCDVVAGNLWWHGHLPGERAREWMRILTEGKGTYCTTAQEDAGTLEALRRGASAGLLEFQRVATLRAGVNFDRPCPGQSALVSLKGFNSGLGIATANLYLTARPLIAEVVARWPRWRGGVPPG